MKTPEEFLKENGFTPAAEIDRQELIGTFISEMEKGLRGEKSSLMMIPMALFIMPSVFIIIFVPIYLRVQASGMAGMF